MSTVDASPAERETILAALDVDLPRPRLPAIYRIGVMFVAVIMLLLPLIYLGLIGAVGYGVYYHAVENATILSGSGGSRGRLVAYVGPILIGLILILFMIKPLFARRRQNHEVLEVDPEQESFLYDFVDRLCEVVGAPAPRRIVIDCQVNASAGFHQGGIGLVRSGRELTLGLPLVGALPVRELAGILAHEFGHFSQGTGMRLSFTVAAVNAWFARVVFERDTWDETLVGWSKSGVGYLAIVAGLARAFVWLTRRLLFGLMWVGRAVSSFMSRQMEFDADRYQIGLSGSSAFSDAMRELPVLIVATQSADRVLSSSWEEKRLADNMPQLIVAQRDKIPDELRAKIDASLQEEETHVFATHPRSIDRIRAAEAARAEGLFWVDAPATVLFDDFDGACRRATVEHYRLALGRSFQKKYLVPTSELVEGEQRSAEQHEAMGRYFRGMVNLMRPVPLPEPPIEPAADPQQTGQEIVELRKQVMQGAEAFGAALQELIAGYDDVANAELAAAFIRSGIQLDAPSFKLTEATESAAAQAERAASARISTTRSDMKSFEGACADRVARMLRMLHVPKVATRIENADELQAELGQLLPAATRLGSVLIDLVWIRMSLHVLQRLHEPFDPEKAQHRLKLEISKQADKIVDRFEEVRRKLGDMPYPSGQAAENMTIVDWAIGDLPSVERPDRLFRAGHQADERLNDLYVRLMARVADIGESTESAIGLKPMPDLRRQVEDESSPAG